MSKMNENYVYWIYQRMLIDMEEEFSEKYLPLFSSLHNIPYYYKKRMDENRVSDAKNLRYRFGNDNHLSDSMILHGIDSVDSVSVLEVLAALCIRFDEHILDSIYYSSRAGMLFFKLLENLGLLEENIDSEIIEKRVEKWLDNKILSSGKGGPVYIPDHSIKKLDLWGQMHAYINKMIQDGVL